MISQRLKVKSQNTILKIVWMTGIVTLSVFFISCGNKTKIPENTLVKVYAEIVIGQDTTTVNSPEFAGLKQKVFNKYKVTSKDYEESIAIMNKDPKQWDKFFDSVIVYVESLKPKKNQPLKKDG